jgi:2-methylcitrate dehydratase PrpD
MAVAADPIASTLAAFVAAVNPRQIPEEVSLRARHLMLDAIGCALAARREPFAGSVAASLRAMAGGEQGTAGVVGFSQRMPLRDAALFNGMLMHGLDYDDTHMAGVIHLTVSVLPAVLNLAARQGSSGGEMLTAYIAAVEAGARIASAAQGGFHAQGFHPTSVVGAFASALAAGRVMGLDAAQLVHAQGVALSMASGSLQFIEDGAWTKRLHPGWAAQAGITAASLAAHGMVAPQAPYTGRYGLYRGYLGEAAALRTDMSLATAGLDADGVVSEWELMKIAVKPFAMCHFVHAATDAAIALHGLLHGRGVNPDAIETIEVLVPQAAVELVCEPAERKCRPKNEYDAKFSLPYAVASGLMRGRLGLAELQPEAYASAEACALMDKVRYRVDAESTFPQHYSGEVRLTLRDGAQLRHREAVNRGHAERPVTNEEVRTKFMENAGLHFSRAYAEVVCEHVLAMDRMDDVGLLERQLARDPQ